MLDNAALKDLLGKKGDARSPTGGCGLSRRGLIMGKRLACRMVGVDRTSVRYAGTRPDGAVLRGRLKELAVERWRFGYRRLHVLLKREGRAVNRKRVQRLYRGEKLTVRRRRGRKRAKGARRPIETLITPNQRWSLDVLSDQLTDGRRFRILAVVDDCTRECLALAADTSLSGLRVARELNDLLCRRGRPTTIVSDNGTELRDRRRLALHRARQAAAERLHRELQRPAARRATERDAVPFPAARPRRARSFAARLQQGATALEARLDDASGLCLRRPSDRRPKRCAT